jgi:hypothetical protein
LLEAELGVILASRPVTLLVKLGDVTAALKVSVLVVDTTCKICPGPTATNELPLYTSTTSSSERYVTIPSVGEGIADPLAAVPANTITD